jgi:hypothetical protein
MFLLLAARPWRRVFIIVTDVVPYRCVDVLEGLRVDTAALFTC